MVDEKTVSIATDLQDQYKIILIKKVIIVFEDPCSLEKEYHCKRITQGHYENKI